MAETRIKMLLTKPPRVRRLHHHAKAKKSDGQKEPPATPPPVPMPPVQEQYMKVDKNDCL